MSKEDNKEEAPEQEQSIWRSLGGTLLYLLVIVLLTWVIVTFVGQRTKVDGHSMDCDHLRRTTYRSGGSLYGEYSSQWR